MILPFDNIVKLEGNDPETILYDNGNSAVASIYNALVSPFNNVPKSLLVFQVMVSFTLFVIVILNVWIFDITDG